MRYPTLRTLFCKTSFALSLVYAQASTQMFSSVQLNVVAPGQSGGMLGVAALSRPEYQGSAKTRNSSFLLSTINGQTTGLLVDPMGLVTILLAIQCFIMMYT
jgi:hypothetical protein